MYEVLEFLRQQFGMTTFELVATVLGVVMLILVSLVATAFRSSEIYVQNKRKLDLLGDFLLDQVVAIEAREADIDLTPYEQRVDERAEQGLEYIDPRMLYLLDKADDYVSARSGLTISFDELLAKSERIFQLYKNGEVL